MGGEGWGASKEEQASMLRQKRADKIVMATCILVQNVYLCKMCIMKEIEFVKKKTELNRIERRKQL